MSRFLLGDDLGNIKVLRYLSNPQSDTKVDIKTAHHQDLGATSAKGVQRLAIAPRTDNDRITLAAAFSDGSSLVSVVKDDDTLEVLSEWKEDRIAANRFVGLSLTESATLSCTSNGMLRMTPFALGNDDTVPAANQCSSLPDRLCDWRLSGNGETFAYGGDEVDLSVWNLERAFQSQSEPATLPESSKKRKRKNDDLFPAEVWRARNVPNDNLGLRQPIRITSLTYISSSDVGHHLVAGTQFGDLRRYDTRAARRPVSNWAGIGKVGGVKIVEKGQSENELFVSDNGNNLFSVDLRTGNVLYSYKGLSGATTSIAPSPTVMISTGLDRYARVHSVVAPPAKAGSHQERKGQVLEKTYLASVPSVVVWDGRIPNDTPSNDIERQSEDDEIWDNMEHADRV
ncbi:hypothetical protein B0H34DRAFT_650386 [Crassisporium funariophilum]|nr:hypothetical protein B0H34DRAFT_650386 [Crassisporium funariophilum]